MAIFKPVVILAIVLLVLPCTFAVDSIEIESTVDAATFNASEVVIWTIVPGSDYSRPAQNYYIFIPIDATNVSVKYNNKDIQFRAEDYSGDDVKEITIPVSWDITDSGNYFTITYSVPNVIKETLTEKTYVRKFFQAYQDEIPTHFKLNLPVALKYSSASPIPANNDGVLEFTPIGDTSVVVHFSKNNDFQAPIGGAVLAALLATGLTFILRRKPKNPNQLKVPTILTIKIYFGLFLATFFFIAMYLVLYYAGEIYAFGWGYLFVGVALIPPIYALLLKPKAEGLQVTQKELPELFSLVSEVAKKLDMKPPEIILLTPGPEIAVSGVQKKTLIIGVAGIRNLTKDEFKSIIGHEMAHLYGGDTVVGSYFGRIQHALETSSAIGVTVSRASPIWFITILALIVSLFFLAYRVLFSIITLFYSRMNEYRADLIAAQITSKTSFHNGLLNYSTFVQYFNHTAYDSIGKLLHENKQFVNVYQSAHNSYLRLDVKKMQEDLIENEGKSIFDSHPTLKQRLKRIPIEKKEAASDPAITLFGSFNSLEETMTTAISDQIHQNILYRKLYAEAVQRQGKCRFCDQQFSTLKSLLKHEEECPWKDESSETTPKP